MNNLGLGLFGGLLGGQMSAIDPLTLYLLQLHQQAQNDWMYPPYPDMWQQAPTPNPDPLFWRQEPLQELPTMPLMDYYL